MNGELKKTVENYTTLSPWNETSQITLTLGGTDDRYAAEDGRSLHGSMREARVWNYARSGDEIRGTMRQRLYGSESGLIGYWPLSAPDATDVSVLKNGSRGNRNCRRLLLISIYVWKWILVNYPPRKAKDMMR